jgi:hypothetical protein
LKTEINSKAVITLADWLILMFMSWPLPSLLFLSGTVKIKSSSSLIFCCCTSWLPAYASSIVHCSMSIVFRISTSKCLTNSNDITLHICTFDGNILIRFFKYHRQLGSGIYYLRMYRYLLFPPYAILTDHKIQ